ncbi:MAG TPA: DUF5947 family protein [Verrucomicrobiae bacterium]|nr:DUF5947 family protein [Verrucomicrobiae bacterium]
MKPGFLAGAESPFATLRRWAQPSAATESCEFCNTSLGEEHRHLFELATRKLICVCDPCALRFENVVGRWKLIPRDARAVPGFQITDPQWESLALPIQLAFFFENSTLGKVIAMYPSPAGATESLLPLANWQELMEACGGNVRLQPDVEALLANRLGPIPRYWVAPIDLCFELVGLMRLHWRGLSGGEKVWGEVEGFFGRLEARAKAGVPASCETVHV